MTSERSRLSILLASLALLGVLASAYAGAYYWRLHVRAIIPIDPMLVSPGGPDQPLQDTIFTTHVDLWLFAPAVRVHQWLNPEGWGRQPLASE